MLPSKSPQTERFKTTQTYLSHSSAGQKYMWSWLIFLFQILQGWNHYVHWLESYQEVLGRIHFEIHSDFWKNSCPCRLRWWSPLLVQLGPFLAPRGLALYGSWYLRIKTSKLNPFHVCNLSNFLFWFIHF